MWGWLSEFWDAINGVALNAWDFTVEWFQNVGNAVAGAIGGLFEYVIHYVNDAFVITGWLFYALKEFFLSLFLPLNCFVNFLKGFIASAIKTPIVPENVYTFSGATMSIFQSIPLWDTLCVVLGVVILFIFAMGIINNFMKL